MTDWPPLLNPAYLEQIAQTESNTANFNTFLKNHYIRVYKC